MSKIIKAFLIIGAILLVIGLAVFLVGLGLNGWKLNTEYTMEQFTATENDSSLDLNMSAGEMNVTFFDGENVEIDYPTSALRSYTVNESAGVISVRPTKQFHVSFFGWDKIPAVTVRIPRGKVMNLSLEMSAGMATVESGVFQNVSLTTSAGTLQAGEIKCGKLSVDMSAGKFTADGAEAGDVELDVSAGTATISGLISDKITVDLSAGSAHLYVTGRRQDYTVFVDKSAGSCNLSSQQGGVAGKVINIDLSAGSVTVDFSD